MLIQVLFRKFLCKTSVKLLFANLLKRSEVDDLLKFNHHSLVLAASEMNIIYQADLLDGVIYKKEHFFSIFRSFFQRKSQVNISITLTYVNR